MPNVNMTTTVQQVLDECRLHTSLQTYFNVGGSSGGPGLGIANRVNQLLLTRRMPWKFNAQILGGMNGNGNGQFLVSQQGQQDIRFAGATAFVLLNSNAGAAALPSGGVSVDLMPSFTLQNGTLIQTYGPVNGGTAGVTISGTTITIQTIDTHPYQAGNVGQSTIYLTGIVNPAFNSVFTYNQLTQSSQWTQGYTISAIIDNHHFQVTANGGQNATITHISISSGIVTLTCANTMSAGDIMTLAGLTRNPGLNGQSVTLTSATATQVTFATATSVTNGTETGTLTASASGAPGLFHFGWLQSAWLTDINSTAFPQPVRPINAVHRIAPEYSTTGDMYSICMLIDHNNGVLQFRLSEPTSSYAFQFNCIYQARVPKLTSPASVFQWPDDLSFVLVELALWQAMRFAYGYTAEETTAQMQVALLALQNAMEYEDREAITQALTPEFDLMNR